MQSCLWWNQKMHRRIYRAQSITVRIFGQSEYYAISTHKPLLSVSILAFPERADAIRQAKPAVLSCRILKVMTSGNGPLKQIVQTICRRSAVSWFAVASAECSTRLRCLSANRSTAKHYLGECKRYWASKMSPLKHNCKLPINSNLALPRCRSSNEQKYRR